MSEYLVSLNATQAAIKAGYSSKYPDDLGVQLLRNPLVQQAITAGKARRAEITGVSAAHVVSELAILGFSDIRHYVLTDQYELALAPGAPDYAMRAIASVKHKIRENYNLTGDLSSVIHDVEYRLWDKNTALTNLAKHTGALVEPDKAGDTVINIQVVRYGDTIIDAAQGRDAQPDDPARLPAQELPARLSAIHAERY